MTDFKFGGPVEPELFYDREREVEFLIDKLSQIKKGIKHNYALVGPRRIGKSSILYVLKEQMSKKNIIPVLIDCEGREITRQTELTLELFLEFWGSAVLDAYFEHAKLQEKVKVRLSDFIVGAKDRIIAGFAEVLGRTKAFEIKAITDYLSFRIEFEKAAERRKPATEELVKLFEDTVDLAERIAGERGVCFVFMLDEFQEVGNFKRPFDFLKAFRRHLQRQKKVAYLFTGSNIGMMENILLRKPFGGHIPIEWIHPFNSESACNFLKDRFSRLRRTASKEAIEEIVNFTNGHPAYLNWFGENCVRLGKEITPAIVKILEERIFEREGLMHVFEEDLSKISPKKGKIFQVFVEMAGHDLESPSKISKKVLRSTTSEVIIYLKRLEQRGFVRKLEEGGYEIVDDMLKNYVKRKIHLTH
ncbi:MAG: ATP-binding protein [Euryarchaeota archaeon]|nr:ATP-binding protein [Euryarchaeota archaeon]